MRKYPYYLNVLKTTFNVGPDLLKTLHRAKPEDTDWYQKTRIAKVNGYGPRLFEYSLKKRWPNTEKERKRIRLGRVLELKNGTKIIFHKTSSWNIEFLDAANKIIDQCKRNDTYETKLLKIKHFIEGAYPHYKDSNVADRIAATILSGFGKVWLEFVDISKKYLEPLCVQNETPALFWLRSSASRKHRLRQGAESHRTKLFYPPAFAAFYQRTSLCCIFGVPGSCRSFPAICNTSLRYNDNIFRCKTNSRAKRQPLQYPFLPNTAKASVNECNLRADYGEQQYPVQTGL